MWIQGDIFESMRNWLPNKTLQKYVMKITDELTKNHWENGKQNYLGIIPKTQGMYDRKNEEKKS